MITPDPKRIGVLAVGVEQYAEQGGNLRGPASQALAIAAWAKSVSIPERNIVLASSWVDDADRPKDLPFHQFGTTAEEVQKALSLVGAMNLDSLVLYWCGHGVVNQKGRMERCLYVSDAFDAGPPVRLRFLSLDQMGAFLRYKFETRNPKQSVDQVRIIDACGKFKVKKSAPQLFNLHGDTLPSGEGPNIYQLFSAEVGAWSQFDATTRTSHFSKLVTSGLHEAGPFPVNFPRLISHVHRGIQRQIADGTSLPTRWELSGTDDFASSSWPAMEALARQRVDLEGPFARAIPVFVPRFAALKEIAGWLSNPVRKGPLLVTGASGSGKTTLLGVIANLAMGAADAVECSNWESGTVPPPGSIQAAIYAQGLDARQILVRVAVAAGLTDDTIAAIADGTLSEGEPIALIGAHLRGAKREVVVLIDAIDRAAEPAQLVRQVLRPLIETCGDVVSLLIGRAGAWESWATNVDRVALDREFADRKAVRGRVEALLRTPLEGRSSAWDVMSEANFDRSVDEIVDIAETSFVLAEEIAAHQRLLTPPTEVDASWTASLPRSILRGMVANLAALDHHGDAQRTLDLLLPLVYARGDGMPWSVWCAVANRLFPARTFNTVGDHELRDALARYAPPGGSDPHHPLYRLRHDALADALLEGSPARVVTHDEAVIVAYLRTHPRADATTHDKWTTASRYALAHIVDHASAAGAADDLLVDLGLVLRAQPAQLLTAFDESSKDDVRQVATVYRSALRWLRELPSLGDRAAQFSLAARQVQSDLMTDAQAAELGASWTARWASWRLQSPHRRLVYGKHQVRAVALGDRDGTPVILAAGESSHVRQWDFATGQVHEPDRAGEVTCLTVNGPLALSGNADDPAIQRWNLDTGDLEPFDQHGAPVQALATERRDGVLLVASGDESGVVHLWIAESGELAANPQAFGEAITAIAITTGSDGDVVVVAALENGSLHARVHDKWRQLNLRGHQSGRGIHALAIRSIPDGGTELVTGGADHRVRAFRLGKGCRDSDTEALWVARHADAVHAIALGTVEDLSVVVSGSDDGTVRVWELDTGVPVGAPYTAHGGWVRAVAAHRSTDGTKIVSGGADGAVHAWDLLRSGPVSGPFAGHIRSVRALALQRHDGEELVLSGSADGTVRKWDPASGGDRGELGAASRTGGHEWVGALAAMDVNEVPQVVTAGQLGVQVFKAGEQPVRLPKHRGWVNSLAEVALPDGPAIVAAGADCIPRVWDLLGLRALTQYDGHNQPVHALAVVEASPDATRPKAVSAGGGGEIHVWDPATGVKIAVLDRPAGGGCVRALAVQGSLVFSAGDDGLIRVHDLDAGEFLVSEPARTRRVNALAVTAGGSEGLRLISAGADGTLRTWDVIFGETGGSERVRISYVDEVIAHRGAIRSLLLVPHSGPDVLYSGGEDGRIGVWDLSLKRIVGGGHEGSVRAVAVARDDKGGRIAVSGGDDATIRTWDLATGEGRAPVSAGRRGSIRSMAAGTRGARSVIVLGSTDNAVRILDLSAQQLEPLVGHTDWVCAVDVATVDRLDVVVSGSDDGSVRLWDLATRRPIRTLPTGDIGSVRALAVVDDSPSPTLVLGSRNREVRAVPLDLEGGQVKVLDEMSDAIQSVGVVRVGDKWATFARDDSGAMAARLLPEGIEFPPPLSGAGEVGGVATIGPGSSIYTGHPRVAVASREVVTVSEWREEAWHLVAAPDLGSDVLALDFDETGQQLLVGARQGVALINLAPSPPAPSELATALPPHGSETGL